MHLYPIILIYVHHMIDIVGQVFQWLCATGYSGLQRVPCKDRVLHHYHQRLRDVVDRAAGADTLQNIHELWPIMKQISQIDTIVVWQAIDL